MPPSPLLRLREHGTTRVEGLAVAEVDALLRSRARLTVTPRSDGAHDVRAAEVVGAFSTSSLRVVVEPKLSIRRLFALLGHARHPWIAPETTVGAEDDLLEALQHVYASALERALSGGLVRAYREERDRLVAPRGRIDAFALATRRFGVLPPVDCAYEELTADVERNRRLLAAATLLARVGQRGSAPVGRLKSAIARMAEVEEVTFPRTSLAPLAFDRRFERYGAALALADVALAHGSVELRDGHVRSVGLLVDMDVVYEDFVTEGLRSAMRETESRWARHPGGVHLGEHGKVRVAPDVVWYGASRVPRLVLDVKYKVTEDAKRADVYQVVAYCRALNVDRAMLVYASAHEERIVVRNGGPIVEVVTLDPDGTAEQLRERLADVAARVRAFA